MTMYSRLMLLLGAGYCWHYFCISMLSTSHGILQAAHFIFAFTLQFKHDDSTIGFYGVEDPPFSPS